MSVIAKRLAPEDIQTDTVSFLRFLARLPPWYANRGKVGAVFTLVPLLFTTCTNKFRLFQS